jgi:hypothetical protein
MVDIRQVPPGGRIDDFLDVVDYVYRDDAAYVRPLDMLLRDQLHPRKNPFFEHGEAAIFCAYRNGRVVGRCTASIDREHLARHNDATGFFGFFDTVDDEVVARELLASAEAWLRARGMKTARGPLSLSINEELGCLVSGFETSPYLMMPHHRPYQSRLIEQAGYAKAKDFYAWSYQVGDLNKRVARAHEDVKSMPEVSYRRTSHKSLDADVATFVDIFNDAWSDNWGFVPFTSREARKMASDFRLLLVPEITSIVSIYGEPAAFALAIPNLNELAGDFGGKLLPAGLPKLLWRLKVQGPRSARLILLGIRKKWRQNRRYAGLSAFMYAEMNNGGREVGIERGELGWTLEDNGRVNAGILTMGAKLYKTYRVFEKSLGGAPAAVAGQVAAA